MPIVRVAKTKLIRSKEGVEAWVDEVRRLIVAPVPVQANEVGFVATPISLMALRITLDRSERRQERCCRDGSGSMRS